MYVIRATSGKETWLIEDGDYKTAIYNSKQEAKRDMLDYLASSDLDESCLKIEQLEAM